LNLSDSDQQEKLFDDSSGASSAEREESSSGKSNPVDCVFCRMVRGEVETRVVFRDETSMAFLDRRPVFLGHCLLIPLDHYETLADLPPQLVGPLFLNVRKLSISVQRAMKSDGSFVAINNKVSQSVPHLHIHVVPRKSKDGLRGFFWPRQSYSSEAQAQEIQRKIHEEMERL
jgi:histidine triad (HIT) family protein